MLFFGHTGITLGIATVLANLPPYQAWVSTHSGNLYPVNTLIETPKSSILDPVAKFVDIRVLLIGSLLPDIIDKPLGHLILRETLSNGRTFGHTLLFFLLITIIGVYLYKKSHKTWLIALSFGTSIHLILDQMWQNSHSLFWPLFGLYFEKTNISDWIPNMLHTLKTNPIEYISEGLGIVMITWLFYILANRKRIWVFIRYGKIR
jgi:inner membrane protein